jgi:hypothetical protein
MPDTSGLTTRLDAFETRWRVVGSNRAYRHRILPSTPEPGVSKPGFLHGDGRFLDIFIYNVKSAGARRLFSY